MRKLLSLIVAVIVIGGVTSAAQAHSTAFHVAKVRYYHANGIVKWIGSNARFTQYSPNLAKKHRWKAAVKFWVNVRSNSWLVMHPRPVVDTSGWQATVDCENGGNWSDSAGYFMYGLQFDPGTWRTAASHTGRWDGSVESQVINAVWTAQHAHSDPWPNCPDPYFG